MLTAYAAYGDRNNDTYRTSVTADPDIILNDISEVLDLFKPEKRE
jgi:hypothetical protein